MGKVQALAYVVAASTDLAKWQHYAQSVLGAATAPSADGNLCIKLDERSYRLLVVPGASDCYQASGWEVASAADLAEAIAAIEAAGIAVERGSAELAAARSVTAIASFTDPSGNRHEISHGYFGGESAFVSPIGVAGFKTGAQGMGHTVLPCLNFDATLKFFTESLGFGLSDVFNFQPAPEAPVMRIYFLHAASGRHHSLALAEMPSPSGCVHIMLEVMEKAEVERAEARREAHGVKLMATLGQHENDKMTSFYMLTPGNFPLEYGWGGISIEPGVWQATETKQVSIWGHDFSVGFR